MPQMETAFTDELAKLALGVPSFSGLKGGLQAVRGYLGRSASGIGAGAGVGALAGTGVGAVGGAVSGYQQAQREGGSGVLGALGGAGSGAWRGATTGAALGAGAGLAAGGRFDKSINALTSSSSKNPFGVAARFGQRQLHGVTGLVPGGAARGTAQYRQGIRSMRDDSNVYGMAGQLREHATDAGKKALEAIRTGGAEVNMGQLRGMLNITPQNQGQLNNMLNSLGAAAEAESKGLTNLPGVISNLAKGNVKDVWNLGVANQWNNQGVIGKGLVGLSALGAGSAALTPADETSGYAERIGRDTAAGLGMVATPFLSMAGADALSRGTGAIGGTIGRGIDALTGTGRIAPQQPYTGSSQ